MTNLSSLALPPTARRGAPALSVQGADRALPVEAISATLAADRRTLGRPAFSVLPAGEMVFEEWHGFYNEYFLG